MTVVTDERDPRTIPGAMAESLRREVPGVGTLEFEQSPAGFLTRKGEIRQKDWRAYFLTPEDGKRTRLPSVTTLLDAILPKGGLPPWYEARGIEGMAELVRRGEWHPAEHTDEDAVQRVRSLRLGADRARDDAAQRGLNVHEELRVYMTTGSVSEKGDHLPEHWGYLRALSRWLIAVDPQPLVVEQLVASPLDGYAGRLDLIAGIGGRRVLVDLKTSEKAAVYSAAHLQTGMYARASVVCGDEPVDETRIVVLAADGEFREMVGGADDRMVEAALAYYRLLRPIESACDSANRAERKARKGTAAS